MKIINHEQLLINLDADIIEFNSKKPFRYIVLENFLNLNYAEKILEETERALRLQGELHAKQVVLDKSKHLNEVFAGVQRIVGVQTAFAERLLNEDGATSKFPIYANEDFSDPDSRPPDFGPEPGKNRKVSLRAAVYKLAPGVSYGDVSDSLERYRALGALFQEHYRANPRTDRKSTRLNSSH